MLANSKAFSGFAVDDLRRRGSSTATPWAWTSIARERPAELHLAGDRATLVYPSPDMSPPTYTILNFPVDDIDAAVDELAARGVELRALRGDAPGREGRDARGRPANRLVQGPGRERPLGAAGAVAPTEPGRHRRRGARVRDDVASHPTEALVYDRVKFRDRCRSSTSPSHATRRSWASASPREEREMLVESEPDKFLLPRPSVHALQLGHACGSLRSTPTRCASWCSTRGGCAVPKKVAAAYDERFFAGEI